MASFSFGSCITFIKPKYELSRRLIATFYKGDWNGDNQTDIAVVNRDNNSVSVIYNSSGLFSISQNLSVNEKPVNTKRS